MNVVKDLLKSGKTVVGTAGSPSVDTAMLSDAGFDFLLFYKIKKIICIRRYYNAFVFRLSHVLYFKAITNSI